MQESFNRLLEQYEFLCMQIDKQTQLLKELSETALYRERLAILQSITGIGKNTLRAILVEALWKLITKDQVMREKYGKGSKSVQGESGPIHSYRPHPVAGVQFMIPIFCFAAQILVSCRYLNGRNRTS